MNPSHHFLFVDDDKEIVARTNAREHDAEVTETCRRHRA
jgi:hypothetical protein